MCKNSNHNIIYVQEQYIFFRLYRTAQCSEKWSFKEQCHYIFCLWFFSWMCLPPAPENPNRTVSNFFRKFAEIFASQGAPPVANFATNFVSVVDIGGKPVVLMEYSGAWGKLFWFIRKTKSRKSRDTVPFRGLTLQWLKWLFCWETACIICGPYGCDQWSQGKSGNKTKPNCPFSENVFCNKGEQTALFMKGTVFLISCTCTLTDIGNRTFSSL